MLLTFSIKNFGPFRSNVTFDMRAVNSYKEHEGHIAVCSPKDRALRAALVYGANASGKSEFVDAYACFRTFVRDSFLRGGGPAGTAESLTEDDAARGVTLAPFFNPFRFSPEGEDVETEFDAEYFDGDSLIHYGFSYTLERVTSEWLYLVSRETNRRSVILERFPGAAEGEILGASVRDEANKYLTEIPDHVLMLSFFAGISLKNDVFKRAMGSVLSVIPMVERPGARTISTQWETFFKRNFNEQTERELVEFLGSMDAGIKGFTVNKTGEGIEVLTHHVGVDGRVYKAPLGIESSGTMKLINLFSILHAVLCESRTLLVDELDAELHPLIIRYIVNMFYSQPGRAQLICTLHDTTLLDRRYLRRDQVWFTDKDESGCSTLYSLSDFKVRNDSAFGSSYLGGAYDAIPKVGHAFGQEVTNGIR